MKKSKVIVSLLFITALSFGITQINQQEPAPLLSRSEEILLPTTIQDELFASPLFADETLHFDGTPFTGVGLTNGGTFYTAARFTPTSACTLKAILFYQWQSSSNDYVFVFGEENDTLPGAVLDSVSYTGIDSMRWKRIDLSRPLVLPAGTDFWACVRLTHTAGTFPIGCDAGPMVRNRGGFLSTNRIRWQQLADVGLNYNWNIRAIISRVPGPAHDVGVSKIVVPGTSIGPGGYQPVARVTNYGTNPETNIPVHCWIDSGTVRIYNQSVTIPGPLQPGTRTEVNFPLWRTGPGGAEYRITMFTDLAGDLNRANDTMRQTTRIANVFALLDHDTGYCKLTVSCFGSIGYDNPPADAGSGFCYPKTAASALFYGSFAMGTGPTYVADRHFSQPANGPVNNDLRAIDSLRPIVPPGIGDEHFFCSFSDATHPTPKNLKVTQHSYMSASSTYDDFIVIIYDIENQGTNPVNGLYAGVFMDFDIGSSPATNQGASDTIRRLTYMRQVATANPTVGVKILEPASYANLSLVDHAIYVYPESAMTDGMKWRFLNGTIVQRNSNRPYDWSVVTSAGPFNIDPGASTRFAIAIVGGSDETAIRNNADAAQNWYNTYVGIAEKPGPVLDPRITISPSPFRNNTYLHYHTSVAGRATIEVFDASGRQVDYRSFDVEPGPGRYRWQPAGLTRGVYFIRLTLPDTRVDTKTLLLD